MVSKEAVEFLLRASEMSIALVDAAVRLGLEPDKQTAVGFGIAYISICQVNGMTEEELTRMFTALVQTVTAARTEAETNPKLKAEAAERAAEHMERLRPVVEKLEVKH